MHGMHSEVLCTLHTAGRSLCTFVQEFILSRRSCSYKVWDACCFMCIPQSYQRELAWALKINPRRAGSQYVLMPAINLTKKKRVEFEPTLHSFIHPSRSNLSHHSQGFFYIGPRGGTFPPSNILGYTYTCNICTWSSSPRPWILK